MTGIINDSRALLLALVAVGAACETREPPPASTTPAPAPAADRPAGLWRTVDDSPQLAIARGADDPALAEAVARARSSAPEAQERWRDTPPDRRGGWGIKWRAPTVDEGVEYLWVEPLAWSRFRIEGRLASPPQRALACGKGQDELVGFPIEELVDWVRYERADFTARIRAASRSR